MSVVSLSAAREARQALREKELLHDAWKLQAYLPIWKWEEWMREHGVTLNEEGKPVMARPADPAEVARKDAAHQRFVRESLADMEIE